MSRTETWDYIAAAVTKYAESQVEQTWRDAVLYWLSRAAADSAIEFARLVKEGVAEEHARVAVQLSMDHVMGAQAAECVLNVGYEEWRKGVPPEPGFGDVRY